MLLPAISFLDKIQMSRRSDRFIFRGKMTVRRALKRRTNGELISRPLERRTKDRKINVRPLKIIPEGDVLDLF